MEDDISYVEFEKYCIDLYCSSTPLSVAYPIERYGKKQYGADAIAISRMDGKICLLECKKLLAVTSTIVRDTCNRFLKNIDFWRGRNIDSFILCTTAELRAIQCISEVLHFWHIFRALKISFAVWDLPTLKRLEGATASSKVRLVDFDKTTKSSAHPQNKIGFLLMDKEVIKQVFELSRAGFESHFFSHISNGASTSETQLLF